MSPVDVTSAIMSFEDVLHLYPVSQMVENDLRIMVWSYLFLLQNEDEGDHDE